ncbi:MAG: pirin family protein [Gammaproteobacteria bacterium]
MIPERIDATTVELGEGMRVRRALPTKGRRLVGAWCFLDHFGPVDLARAPGMRIGPHPHIGLQTVTWLLKGELHHRDSLGTSQRIAPGAVNLMTAGRGISHSEDSPADASGEVHGVQFWIALPDFARHMAPAFEHHPKVPLIRSNRLKVSLVAGEMMGERSPAGVHSPLVGAHIVAPAGAVATLPLKPEWEHGAIVTYGRAEIAGQRIIPGSLVYLPPGRNGLPIVTGAGDAGFVLVGGAPFTEQILMWWNFVGRTKDELTRASRDWNDAAEYLGDVQGAMSPRLVAPMPPWTEGPPTVTVTL